MTDQDARRLAAESRCDLRTVRSMLVDPASVRPVSRTRIEEAAKRLKIKLPRA